VFFSAPINEAFNPIEIKFFQWFKKVLFITAVQYVTPVLQRRLYKRCVMMQNIDFPCENFAVAQSELFPSLTQSHSCHQILSLARKLFPVEKTIHLMVGTYEQHMA
jgi:hypothetical protein